MAEPDTVELRVAPSAREPARARIPGWRGITGAFAAGWSVVFLLLLAAQILAWTGGGEGPGAYTLVGHLVGGVLAGGAQYVADRGDGVRAGVAGGAVVVLTLTMLWLFWWS